MSEHEHAGATRWHRFWNRGGWWKALAVAVVYLVVYEGLGLLLSVPFGHLVDSADILATPESVFFGLALPILLGGIILLLFVWSLGWLREIFGPQPIRGSWWMWIGVALLLIPIALRVVGTNWSAYSVGVALTMLFTGLCIGLAEELVSRGLAVNLLRRAGYGEKAVMLLSSLIFALMHSVNAFTQPLLAVALTVVYTFTFGIMMYLVLRVTGSIIWPMLVHAATDPTTILATGGVDAHGDASGSEGLIALAGDFNSVYVVFAIIAIIFVKGKVFPDRTPSLRKAEVD
ncbi:CPBP family intramembrane glutamic endopeptidase [Agromyces larvae]|uniref:CPBP family intramembrane metalloprotease n=1 Tax=Agromyces larvae TaxID=2929802 RepID=A0ABY4C0T2_9MICO|nr:CPBP family intramembrane glutamic endopeptidase [Agromyces larvae]UOE43573.1 CPBP family intramembrane metalloprotease [Agromyces larvae]